MKKKAMTVGITVGLGTLGYWLFQEFKKSDRTVSGTLNTVGEDMHTGYNSSKVVAKRFLSAFRAGAQEWRKEKTAVQSSLPVGSQVERGNGGTPKVKSTSSTYSSESRI